MNLKDQIIARTPWMSMDSVSAFANVLTSISRSYGTNVRGGCKEFHRRLKQACQEREPWAVSLASSGEVAVS